MSASTTPQTFRGRYASRLVRETIAKKLTLHRKLGHSIVDGISFDNNDVNTPIDPDHLPPISAMPTSTRPPNQPIEGKACIVGAGAAGLYTAMILDSLGLSYDLLEANDRNGGRVYTYPFPPNLNGHQYVDFGAMRFPHMDSMSRSVLFRISGIVNILEIDELHIRLFDLFSNPLINLTPSLIPYYLSGLNTPSYYNDTWAIEDPYPQPQPYDPFHVSTGNGGMVSPRWVFISSRLNQVTHVFLQYYCCWRNHPGQYFLAISCGYEGRFHSGSCQHDIAGG